MSKEFGDYLRELRRINVLTQKQVAEALHIDRSTYAYYECGTTEPSLITVRKMAEVFGVSVNELLPDTDDRMTAKVRDIKRRPPIEKDKDEAAFLRWYRNLSPEQKEELKAFAGTMNKKR